MSRLPLPRRCTRILVVFSVAMFLTWSISAQTAGTPAPVPPSDLDSYVATAMNTFEVPGLSLAIVKDGKIVLAKGYGVRKLGDSMPVDEHTMFGIGSNTKAFTTAALAMLVDAGKLSWDDPAYQRMPNFVMYDPYVSHEMTIRDLVAHRGGIGMGEGDLLWWPQSIYTREEIIYKLRFMKPAYSFRSHFAYDSLLYLTAGQIIPAVTGTSWDEYIRKNIFLPLGMADSNTSVTDFKPGVNYASPHSRVDGKLQVIPLEALDNVGPAASINSCAMDMAKWLQVQLNHGKFPDRDGRLFSERQSREMWAPQTLLPVRNLPPSVASLKTNFSAYSLGWFLRDYHGKKVISHTGGVAGFVSRVIMIPDENLGAVVLTNAEASEAFDSILYHILDPYLGLPLTNWTANLKQLKDEDEKDAAETMKKAESSRAANSKPSLPLEKYAGVYNDAWYGPISIRVENTGLVISFDHTPGMIGDLQPWQYDTFKAHWRRRTIEDAFVTFSLKPDGSIESARLEAVSPLADFSFDYQDLLLRPEEKKRPAH